MSREYTFNNGERTVPCTVVATHGETVDLHAAEAGSNDVKLFEGIPQGTGGLEYQVVAK